MQRKIKKSLENTGIETKSQQALKLQQGQIMPRVSSHKSQFALPKEIQIGLSYSTGPLFFEDIYSLPIFRSLLTRI